MMPRPRVERTAIVLGVALAAVAVAQAAAYWPGIMYWDAVRQYGQAVAGSYDDWHPPAMEWLWRQLRHVHVGPAPMLLLQLGLYWAGFALLCGWALRAGRSSLATMLAACALLPIPLAIMGSVLKDSLMAGALLSATGLLAWSPEQRGWLLRGAALLLLLFAATLRFNALFAALPLFVALLPEAMRRSRERLIASTVAAALLLAMAMPVANRLIGARPSGVELSLVIFDLGGITEHSGVDAFPPLPVAEPVAVNHRCYSPVRWDPYAWWVDEPCPIGFALVRATLLARRASPYPLWIGAIARHPIAYAEHRLRHFNVNTRFLIHGEIERPVENQSAPNPWNYTIAQGPVQRTIDGAAVASGSTPLGWPIFWLAVAAGALILAPRVRSSRVATPLALSALLYGGDYLVFSVAADLRYHLWTMLGALVAAVIVAGDCYQALVASRRRMLVAAAPAALVLLLCSAWRLAGS